MPSSTSGFPPSADRISTPTTGNFRWWPASPWATRGSALFARSGRRCGGVQALRGMGVETVLALDLEESRLALVAEAGAIPVPVGDGVDVSKAVKEHTDGRGADAAIDAVGLVPGYETALRVSRRGGRVCVLGVYGPDERIEVRMGAYW